MADVTVTVTPTANASVTVSNTVAASSVTFDPSSSDLTDTDLQNAIVELALEKFAQAAAPSTGVTEGDLWYDTDDDKFYARDEDSWNEVVTSISGTVDGGSF